jgi:hypothetical protein
MSAEVFKIDIEVFGFPDDCHEMLIGSKSMSRPALPDFRSVEARDASLVAIFVAICSTN